MRALKSIFILIGAIFLITEIYAQTCCSGGVPVSGNVGLFPEKRSSLQFNFSYDYNLLNKLKDFSSTLEGSNRRRITQSLLLESSYSLTDRLSIYGFISFVQQERLIRRDQDDDLELTRGVGDAVLMPGFLAIDDRFFKWFISAGVKFPLGKTDIRRNDGILLNPDLQPGSGAYDGVILSMLRFEAPKGHSFWNQVAYRRTGTNKSYRGNDDYRFGNEMVASLGWSKNLFLLKQVLEPSISLAWRNAGVDQVNENTIPNTGGNWWFLSSGISYYIMENLNVFGSVSIPLYSEPSGVQLTTTSRLTMGLYYDIRIGQNKKILNF